MGAQSVAVERGIHKVLIGKVLMIVSLLFWSVLNLTSRQWGNTYFMVWTLLTNEAGLILNLIGFAIASVDSYGYRKALWCVAINMLLLSASGITTGLLQLALTVVAAVLEGFTVFLSCRATSEFLERTVNRMCIQASNRTWKAACMLMAAALACYFIALSLAPSGCWLGFCIAYVALWVAATLIYLIFLFGSWRAMKTVSD